MPEVKIKTIEIDYGSLGGGDPMDMITITRRQYREALIYCLAAFHKADPGGLDEAANDRLTQLRGSFAAGLEYKLFNKEN